MGETLGDAMAHTAFVNLLSCTHFDSILQQEIFPGTTTIPYNTLASGYIAVRFRSGRGRKGEQRNGNWG